MPKNEINGIAQCRRNEADRRSYRSDNADVTDTWIKLRLDRRPDRPQFLRKRHAVARIDNIIALPVQQEYRRIAGSNLIDRLR